MEDYFKSYQPDVVFLNQGTNSDSGLSTEVADEQIFQKVCTNTVTNKSFMHDVLVESRVIKNSEEIAIMRWASKITCEAHCHVMRNVKPGQRESQLATFFR